MAGMVAFDDTVAATIEAMYSTADMVQQRRAVLDLLDPQVGEHVLDIGCGPGLLTCEIAQRIGPRGSVDGVDPSQTSQTRTCRAGSAGCSPTPASR
jgi:ubiquinone/menaquinone biosynthesis C-methylase UbiE